MGTTSTAPVTLPLERRHSLIVFTDEDGGTGSGACAWPINFEEVYNLKGRLLTIIDATFTDPQQRKAQKDVVWQALQAWMSDVVLMSGQEPPFPTKHVEGDG